MANVVINTPMDKVEAQRLLDALKLQRTNWDAIKAKQLADLNARIAALESALAV